MTRARLYCNAGWWPFSTGLGVGMLALVLCLPPARERAAQFEEIVVPSNLPWSVRMAQSEMNRKGDSFEYAGGRRTSWVYESGFFFKGLEQVWRQTGDEKYFAYIQSFVDSYVEPGGKIKTYDLKEYNLDHINCGKLLLFLYRTTQAEKYRQAAFLLRQQLETHPRTTEGGFWHKKIYPWQMWLDGIYMASPFYAEFAAMFDQPGAFDDVANQILFIAEHTRDPRTGLFYHGWDESRQQKWADPVTGRSPSFWGRAIGWYAMGIVEVLDFLPAQHPQRAHLLAILQDLAQALVKYQDQETGLWYQVVDQVQRPGNFLEASASSMFVYALAKSLRLGYLGNEFKPAVDKGYEGILQHFIKVEPNGLVDLTQVCRVAGLGGEPYRDGSYEYYINTPLETNDLKGVGAFILASVEMEKAAQNEGKAPSH